MQASPKAAQSKYAFRQIAILWMLLLLVSACQQDLPASDLPVPTGVAGFSPAPTETATIMSVVEDKAKPNLANTASPVPKPSNTLASSSDRMTITFSTPTPTWILNHSGKAVVPILLYHHVNDDPQISRYAVKIEAFKQQMEFLNSEGFTAITISELAHVLRDGGSLPVRPVVITFDDGNFNIYQNAFPIMQALGFHGVMYVVNNRLESEGFLSANQLKELSAAGWEIGSHSMTHPDLSTCDDLNFEIYQSRIQLQEAIGVPVLSFAYPYAKADSRVFAKMNRYGYLAAVCVSPSNQQMVQNIYCLPRREVKQNFSMDQFQELIHATH